MYVRSLIVGPSSRGNWAGSEERSSRGEQPGMNEIQRVGEEEKREFGAEKSESEIR